MKTEIVFDNRHFFVVECQISRRNEVFLVKDEAGERFILKRYLQGSQQVELDMLTRLKTAGVKVPDILGAVQNELLLSYIEGENLCDTLERCENEDDHKEWAAVCFLAASWFLSFYGAFEMPVLRGDVNLRNFILAPDARKLYGVDFESFDEGSREEDAGRMAGFVLTYSPAFTSFKRKAALTLVEALRAEFPLDEASLRRAFCDELDRIKTRRGMDIPDEAYVLL